MVEELQRVYTIPLGKAYDAKRTKRGRRAAKLVRAFLIRHMKPEDGKVRISSGIGRAMMVSGMGKPPRRIKVVARRDKQGKVEAYLQDEKEKKPKQRKAKKKVTKEKPKPEKEPKPEEKTDEADEKKKKEDEKEMRKASKVRAAARGK